MKLSASVKGTLARYSKTTPETTAQALSTVRQRMDNTDHYLLTIEGDTKTVKGSKYGYRTAILYLAPSSQSGVMNTCAMASAGCKAGCLFTAGRGSFDGVTIASRIQKTIFLHECRDEFITRLRQEIKRHVRLALRDGVTPVVRINGTSDLAWLALQMVAEFPDVQFYDYTKLPHAWTRTRTNYHLTFSHSENNESECIAALEHGVNVAVVFDSLPAIKGRRDAGQLPETWHGYRVVDGDNTDLRFLDSDNGAVVVGLRAKGQAQSDCSGFVVKANTLVQLKPSSLGLAALLPRQVA